MNFISNDLETKSFFESSNSFIDINETNENFDKSSQFLICPKCRNRAPLINSVYKKNGTVYIKGNCRDYFFDETLSSFLINVQKEFSNIDYRCNSVNHLPNKHKSNGPNEDKAVAFCLDCSSYLCKNCFDKHNKNKNKENFHFLVNSLPQIGSECKKHQKEYILICEDCKIPLCQLCIKEGHNYHSYKNLEKLKQIVENKKFGKFSEKKNLLEQYFFYVESQFRRLIKVFQKDLSKEDNLKYQDIFVKSFQNIYYEKDLILKLLSNLSVNGNDIITLNNLAVINEIFPLIFLEINQEMTKSFYLDFLKNASILDYDYNLSHKEILKMFEEIGLKIEDVDKFFSNFCKLFTDKGIFYGQIEKQLKEGKGIFYYNNGETFIGEFNSGNIKGEGKRSFTNGDYYKGTFDNNKFEGLGKYYYKDKGTYIGTFHEGIQHNSGKFIYDIGTPLSGYIYEGELIDNYIKNGYGILTFPNKNIYEGNFIKDEMTGQGKLFYDNGNVYEGEFLKGKKYGRGILKYNDGSFIEGTFNDDLVSGLGKSISTNGEKYEGYFLNSKRNGEGILYKSNGSKKYEGSFKEDKFSGKGIFYFDENKRVEGFFLNDELNGKGIEYNEKNEIIFDGFFKNGNFHDEGTFVFENGEKYFGNFKLGKFHGKGVLYYKDGKPKYSGEWKEGKRDGKGTSYKRGGDIAFEGFWKEDQKVDNNLWNLFGLLNK